MNSTTLLRFPRAIASLTAVGFLGITAGFGGAVNATTTSSTEIDVMAWLDDVSTAIVVDQSANCMAGATDPVAYRNDRIVLRTGQSNAAATAAVNARLNAMYATPTTTNWVASPIERITFPIVPPNTTITPVLAVNLLPRPLAQQHDIVGLARRLRNDSQITAGPDYALPSSGPYSFFWPEGYPENIATLTAPRLNQTPAGLPVGTGVKIEVYDTGLANGNSANLPTTTRLSANDNEIVDANNDQMADYPAAGHGMAIAGVLSVIAPGSVIQEARISERSGLATDVTAARGMASSLRSLPRNNWPSLIVNSFGTVACDLDPTTPGPQLTPVGLEAVVEVTDRFDPIQPNGMLIVASAGNMASTRPHYPAAFASVVGVGALDGNVDPDGSPWSAPARTAPIADFSNRGAWVDVWAPGVDLPTTHVNGVRFEFGGQLLAGKASVDGTSFAAPLTAGVFAEHMSTNGVKARVARDAVIATGVAPLPQCGTTAQETGRSIVLSSLTATATGQPTGAAVTC